MQTATSEMESKSRDLSICVHHYTLRAPCPKGQGNVVQGCQHVSRSSFRDNAIIPALVCLEHCRRECRSNAT